MINSISGQMDRGVYSLDFNNDYGQDIHTVASLLKKFFKELPDPMFPESMYSDFLACARLTSEKDRLSTLKDLVYRLPTAHYHTLKYLMQHLSKVTARSKENLVRNNS